MIVADLDGVNTAGTASGISPSGLLVTNKHVVRTDAGPAKRIGVIYANTNEWIAAHMPQRTALCVVSSACFASSAVQNKDFEIERMLDSAM